MQKESQQARPWGEVAGSEQFQALPAEHQERARELYFQDNVMPRVPKGMEQRARELFDQDTMGAPAQSEGFQRRAELISAKGLTEQAVQASSTDNPITPLTIENQQRVQGSMAGLSMLPVEDQQRIKARGLDAERESLRRVNNPPQMKPYEPTLWDSVKGIGGPNKDAATVEIALRETAKRENISIDEAYRRGGFARGMFNPEGRPAIQALSEAGAVVGRQAVDIAPSAANTVLRAVRGGDVDMDTSWLDSAVEATTTEDKEWRDPNYQGLQGIGESIGFSLVNMAASAASAAAATAATGPAGGAAAGLATSGTISYRASRDQFIDRVRKNYENVYRRKPTQKEWEKLQSDVDSAATKYGAYEAIPEAISTMIFVRSLARPLSGASRGGRLGDALARIGQNQGSEQTSEMITGVGQNRAELEAGLTKEELSSADVFRQQALNVALTSGAMSATGMAGRAAYDATPYAKRRAAERGADQGKGLDLDQAINDAFAQSEQPDNTEQLARQSLDPANAQIQADPARPAVAGLQAVPGTTVQQDVAPTVVAEASVAPAAAPPAAQDAAQPAAREQPADNGTGVFRVPVEQIKVDPQAYQFRSKVDDKGTDKRLDAVAKWDDRRSGSVVLHRRADGSLYVADGHHRVALAKRLGQPAINAVILDEADGVDVPAARREAAMINISGGNAEALDVAKVFRDSAESPAEVRAANNLPANQATADGQALASLGDNVFGMVAAGQLDEKSGAAIGAGFSEPAQQEEAARVFQKIQPATAYQRELLVQEIRSAEFTAQQGEQPSLFGDDEQQVSLLQNRLAVLDKLRQALNADKRLFASLNDNADRAVQAGNTIATEANAQITEASKKSLAMLGRITTTPALNQMVNRASQRIAGGEPVAAVVRELKKEMIGYGQDATGARRTDSAGGQSPDRTGAVAGASQRLPALDANGADQAREPGPAREGARSAVQPTEDFQLGQQSETELADLDRQQKERAKAAAEATRKADEQARKAAEAAFAKQQNEAANAEFALGGDAEQNLTGQRGMFDAPAGAQPAAAPEAQNPTEREQGWQDRGVMADASQEDNGVSLGRLDRLVAAGRITRPEADILVERSMKAARKARDRAVAGDYIDEAVERIEGTYQRRGAGTASTIEQIENGRTVAATEVGPLNIKALTDGGAPAGQITAAAAKTSKKAKQAEQVQRLREHFAPGNILKSYGGGHDRVIAYTPAGADGRWSVTVRAVSKDGDTWVDVPSERERIHATQPDERELRAGPVERVAPAQTVAEQLSSMDMSDLSALIDQVSEETAAPQTSKPKAQRSRKAKTLSGKTTARKVASKAELADVANDAEVSRAAGAIAKSLGVNMSAAGMNALEGLTKLFGGPGRLNSGLSFDEESYAKAKPHFAAAMADIQAAGKDLRDFIRALVGQFGDGVKPYIVRYAQDLKQEQQDERANRDLEPDRPADSAQGAGQDLLDDQSGEGGRRAESMGAEQGGQRADAAGGLRGDRPPAAGERGNQQVDGEQSAVADGAAGSADSGRGRPTSTGGLYAERDRDGAADQAPAGAVTPAPAQVKASNTPATLAEIKAQLPFLTEGQAEDVVFAEKRLMQPQGYGVLYTNGTGTGKTFTGLGVMARAVARGQDNILVVAPKQTIVDAWIKAGEKFFGLQVKALDSIQDNGGKGIVATTYANLAANNSLALREWDMVIADEAHYLSSAEDGSSTGALSSLRALTKRRGSARQAVDMQNAELLQKARTLQADAKVDRSSDDDRMRAAAKAKDAEALAIFKELDEKGKALAAEWEGAAPASKPRAVFLSATPFAYEKNVGWAQQFLFDWGVDDGSQAYNAGGSFERFMMQHFGYRMRYNKLTAPDAQVDSGLMQRAFNSWLKREGALSARALDSHFDYDRLFVTVDSPIGRRVDDALKWLRDMTRTKDDQGNEQHQSDAERAAYSELHEKITKENFNYHARMYFLEAIKAREAIPHIRAQLAAGRKVLIMHDFKQGGAANPFVQRFSDKPVQAAYEAFADEFSDLIQAFNFLPSPISQLSKAFPDALVYNGSVPARQRIALQDRFNDDADDSPRVIIAQGDAMREGVSIHDTTGKFPRVLVHLGMPVKPTAAIQQEGRIYRTGQASHALFRYFTIGSSWERAAFAGKIATRASAAENLAMGEQARGLKQAFIEAYENADLYAPGFAGEGAGGKAADRAAAAALTPWDMAKSFYFGSKKQGAGRSSKGREGVDYFATPEPVGLKMVEWADIRGGDSVLEPSAGHGAIARWFPDSARVRVIEQSAELASRVALHVDGDVVHGSFEEHNIVNKYDAIVMNPPYGLGGSVAIPHLAKAAEHLRDGGRVVALIPVGPAADKKFDNWLYAQDKNGKPLHPDLHLVGDVKMPAVTFERAGTAVATRVVIIERVGKEQQDQVMPARQADLSGAGSIGELFGRLESLEMSARVRPVETEAEQTTPTRSVAAKRNYAEIKAEQTGKYTSDAPIVEHVTKGGKGKTLRGVIVRDMSLDEVKAAYNEYAFKKDGGVFLREEFVQRQEAQLAQEEARFSRAGLSPASVVTGKAPAKPISVAQAEAAALAFLADYNGNVPLTYRIKKTQHELYGPAGSVQKIGIVKGAYHPGRGLFTLAADHLSDSADVRETLRHEILGHYGLDTFRPSDKQAFLEKIIESRGEPSLKAAWAHVDKAYGDMAEIVKAEEVFAFLAEQDRGVIVKALDALRSSIVRLLRAVGYKRKVVTRAELLREVEVIAKGIRSGRRSYQGTGDGTARLRLLGEEPAIAAQPEQGRLGIDTEQQAAGIELPAETAPRKAQRLLQDKLNRFTVIREWLAERGVDLGEDADVYRAEERMHSRFSNKAKDFREKTVQPLVEKIQQAGYAMEDVAQYLHAQHAQERNAQIARINRQMPDGGSGMSNAEAREILAGADQKLVRLANELRAITDGTRKVLLDSGLIGKEQADAWQKAYQHYVPLKGGPDDKAAQAGTGKGLKVQHKTKRALGHKVRGEGEWIIENILADHERALLAAEKNAVAKHLLKMAMRLQQTDLDIMTVGQPEKRGVLRNQVSYEVLYKGRPVGAFDTQEGAQLFKASAPLSIGKAASPADVTIRKSNDPSVVYMASPMPAPNEAQVYIDGDIIRIQIKDDLLARAYGNMGADALGTFMRSAQALNRWFSSVYTGYNPEFLITNVIRDFTTGLANITGEEGALFAAKATKNYFTSFAALLRYASKGATDPWIRQYREDGGNTGAAYLSDLERLGADMQAEYAAYQGVMANLRKGSLKGAARAAGRKAFNATLRHLEALNEAGENAMRLALYRTAVEQGMTRNKAASMAKNTTVNFNRKGELGAQANALYLFFNAGVQGTTSLAHAHFKGKNRQQAWAVSGAMAALGYSLAMLVAGGEDDENEKTPDYTKERNLVIPLGDGKSLTIPVPYGYGFYFNVGRLLAEAQRTGKTDDMAWQLASSFAGEFTPFSGAVAGDEPDMLQTGLFLLPTMAQIPMAVATNRSSFGGPMYPENPNKRYEPDRLKMWRGTEGTWADSLAGALESVGADVSPETLKHMSRTFTGGAGNFVGSTIDAATLSAQGATPEVREVPFLRKFYRENGVGDARSRFWRYQGEARKAVEDFQRAVDAGDRERVQTIVRENRELIAMADVAKAFSEAAGAARDRVQQIRLGDLPIAEKRAQIQKIEEREAELYDRFVRVFKERAREK